MARGRTTIIINPMEHHDRVVEGISHDGQQRGNHIGCNLTSHQSVDTDNDNQIMDQSDDCGNTHLIFEADRDIDDDQRDCYYECYQ